MSATIREIAERTGLSVMTVSRVLTGKAHLHRTETRDRVLEVARELGYLPNAAARAMRAGRFGYVALLLTTAQRRSELAPGLLQGIHDALAEERLQLTIARLPDEQLAREGAAPQILSERGVDGLIVNYTDHIPEAMLTSIREHHVPSVWVNSKQPADCVYPDDFGAGRRAAEHLLALGHRRIAYADYVHGEDEMAEAHYSTRDRQAGYEVAMREAGLEPRVLRGRTKLEGRDRVEFSRLWLSAPDRPTAVITYGDREVDPMFLTAERLGLRWPEGLSLATFGNVAAMFGGLRVTTLLVPQYRLGQVAVAMVLEKIESPQDDLPPRAVEFEFEPGETAVPPG